LIGGSLIASLFNERRITWERKAAAESDPQRNRGEHNAFPFLCLKQKEKDMKEALIKLFKVKSFITLILTVVFAHLAIIGAITGQEFLTIFTVIISFYFGTQVQRKVDEDK